MSKKYEYKALRLSDLLLDAENPRFASSALVKGNAAPISQEAIMEHLLRHANVIELAKRINDVGELHGSELVTCYPDGDKYVVLEGNRRVCACKLLLMERSLISDKYRKSFPFTSDTTKENVEIIQVCIYPDRQSAQSLLSDRHITGVKKWSALEKNNYYMNLFQEYKSVTKIKEYTDESEGNIKNSIKKYQFFMDVFHVVRTKHANIVIEEIDYLPMVDRFMGILVESDPDVGLNLHFDEASLRYSCDKQGEKLYNEILLLVGEAFLIRKDRRLCESGELSKIIGSEIMNQETRKNLILDDVRIPGLLDKISQYKALVCTAGAKTPPTDSKEEEGNGKGADDNGTSCDGNDSDDRKDPNNDSETDSNGSTNGDDEFVPNKKFQPKKGTREFLTFTQTEAKNFKISGNSDYEEKIKSLIWDLSKLSVNNHPYACAMLYRSLLEICTKFVYHRNASIVKNTYDEDKLKENMLHLLHNVVFANKTTKDIPKIKTAIKERLNKFDLIGTLNLYIHHSNPVDENILLSSWNTMKFYIIACLEM